MRCLISFYVTSTLKQAHSQKRKESKRYDTKHFELLIYCPWTNSLKVSTNVSPKADSSVEQYSKWNSSLYFVTDLFKVKENKLACVYMLACHMKNRGRVEKKRP